MTCARAALLTCASKAIERQHHEAIYCEDAQKFTQGAGYKSGKHLPDQWTDQTRVARKIEHRHGWIRQGHLQKILGSALAAHTSALRHTGRRFISPAVARRPALRF
jgi:hypothetical protein